MRYFVSWKTTGYYRKDSLKLAVRCTVSGCWPSCFRLCVCEQIGCRMITSTILYWFSPNFACGWEMWSHWRHCLWDQHQIPRTDKIQQCRLCIQRWMKTEIEIRFLEMCKFRIWFRLGITSTILYQFSPNFACGSEMWSFRQLLFVRQTGNSLPILQVCGFRFQPFSGSRAHIFKQIS